MTITFHCWLLFINLRAICPIQVEKREILTFGLIKFPSVVRIFNVYKGSNVIKSVNSLQRETKTKPKFCPNCGVKLVAQRKFCSECGFSLKDVFKPEVAEEPLTEPQEEVEIDYNELGNKLEMVVEEIFRERGYKTER